MGVRVGLDSCHLQNRQASRPSVNSGLSFHPCTLEGFLNSIQSSLSLVREQRAETQLKKKVAGGRHSGALDNKNNNNSQILNLPCARHAIKCFLHITSCFTTAPGGQTFLLTLREAEGLRDLSHSLRSHSYSGSGISTRSV